MSGCGGERFPYDEKDGLYAGGEGDDLPDGTGVKGDGYPVLYRTLHRPESH